MGHDLPIPLLVYVPIEYGGYRFRGHYSHPELLGGVDKFEPVSGGSEMDHAEEAVGQLVIAGGDRPVDFETTEHAFDAIPLLVERPVMLDFYAAV